MLDCIIIGMGPAGISSAIYSKKANLNVLVLESSFPGGKLNKIKLIDNYPGFNNISGSDLALNMFNHFRKENIDYKITKVLKIEDKKDYKLVYTDKGNFKTFGVILACGKLSNRKYIANEEKYINKGISYCSICDGSLYKDKNVVVIGNNDSCIEDALYLKNICKSVTICTNGNNLNIDGFKIINGKIIEFTGIDNIDGIILDNKEQIKCDGVFISDNKSNDNSFISELNITDKNGYIIVDEKMKTKINNVYACGDVIKKDIYQISTAVSEGCVAAINLNKALKDKKDDNN